VEVSLNALSEVVIHIEVLFSEDGNWGVRVVVEVCVPGLENRHVTCQVDEVFSINLDETVCKDKGSELRVVKLGLDSPNLHSDAGEKFRVNHLVCLVNFTITVVLPQINLEVLKSLGQSFLKVDTRIFKLLRKFFLRSAQNIRLLNLSLHVLARNKLMSFDEQ
jgi:hypothetical protein